IVARNLRWAGAPALAIQRRWWGLQGLAIHESRGEGRGKGSDGTALDAAEMHLATPSQASPPTPTALTSTAPLAAADCHVAVPAPSKVTRRYRRTHKRSFSGEANGILSNNIKAGHRRRIPRHGDPLHRHHSHPRHGRGREGQLRPSWHADGAGTPDLYPLATLPSL